MAPLLAISCGAPRTLEENATPPVDVSSVLQDLAVGHAAYSYERITTTLGVPVREMRSESAAGDTLRTLMYFGFEIGIQEATSQVAHLALTDARYTPSEGVRVGYAESQVLRQFGPPLRRSEFEWAYDAGDGVELIVFLKERSVSRLEWRFAPR